MKRNRRGAAIILLALACIVLASVGTYAAYTNHAYVKRVVSTQSVRSDLRFSSNYLLPCSIASPDYPQRLISVGSETDAVFGVTVCNYPLHDLSRVNEGTVTYTFTAELVNPDGTAYTGDTQGITVNNQALPVTLGGQTLPGGTATQQLYTVRIPADKIATLGNASIRLLAMPEDGSATEDKALAGQLRIVSFSAQSVRWSGRFTDDLSSPAALDAFNYELSGSSQGTVTLSWDASRVQLGQWSRQLLGVPAEGNPVSFTVGGADQPDRYRLQFYRIGGIPEGETSADVSGYVTCGFVEADP